MNLIKIIIFTLLGLSIFGFSYAQSSNNNNIEQHPNLIDNQDIKQESLIIEKGQTLYSISIKYKTTVEKIFKLNPWAINGIKVGDKLILPLTQNSNGNNKLFITHLITPRETLFSISQTYKVSIDDIIKVNPGLTQNTFISGKVIKIPDNGYVTTNNLLDSHVRISDKTHKVTKGETLYSISRYYNVTVSNLMKSNISLDNNIIKEGQILNIPSSQNDDDQTDKQEPSNNSKTSNANTIKSSLDIINQKYVHKIAILLPFKTGTSSVKSEKLIEYYNGLLLAVKKLKENGINSIVYTFDIGNENDTERLKEILETNELQNVDLIIGGINKAQINTLSSYSKQKRIKYVIPFASHDTNTNNNPYQIRVTSSMNELTPVVCENFVKLFTQQQIVIFTDDSKENDKNDFIISLKKTLYKNKINYNNIIGKDSLTNYLSSLNEDDKIVIVPTSSSEPTITRILSIVKSTDIKGSINLFGYPEWQLYKNLYFDLSHYNTYIYSTFFLDERGIEVQQILKEYNHWYGREMAESYPKFGFLGYDMGIYFISALEQMEKNNLLTLAQFGIQSLQISLHFSQDDRHGGYTNKGLYFIHFNNDLSIDKVEINR